MHGSWKMSDFSNAVGGFGLSREQADAVIGTENVFVQACPGSGKTRSVAARVAWTQREQRSLALLSFTKVGAEEISRAAWQDHSVIIGAESFVGTVQSFLQKYVLTPFGHLVTGASVGVRIDPDQVDDLDPTGLGTADYHFRLDGSLAPNKGPSPSSRIAVQVTNAKLNTAKQGFVGQEDDVYWSYRTLESFPDVRRAVATRFDEIIVDEAQDLNELQIECLRLLKATALDSLVLVGDYDQTIYQWRGSNPALCEDLAEDAELLPKPLTENYRSSQVICNMATKFRSIPHPDKAVGEYRNCSIPPTVLRYTPGEEESLPARLERVAEQYGIVPESMAVLVRRQAVKNQIVGRPAPTVRGSMKTLLAVKQSFAGPTLEQYREVERLLLRRAFGTSAFSATLDREVIRSASIAIIDDLPSLEGTLRDWADAASGIVDAWAQRISPAFIHTLRATSFPETWREIDVVPQNSANSSPNVRVDTVYAFKGESIDAVMLVAGDPTPKQKTYGFGDATSWSEHLGAPAADITEDARVAYVAITRARRLCVLALPHDTKQETVEKFIEAGFKEESQEDFL